ncbi:uncharacterized protein [Elaeis guineensis]|uniref:Uncharacterized protein LOC105035495 isoform X2 n=1 Tax=Elaeis guineensis var. tenera TaxID=51953 RepID=A0A6I9QH46_ELAGV|nr:uncharacterized protein LOC105035495 isoform X2 [Elaeis guineensis]
MRMMTMEATRLHPPSIEKTFGSSSRKAKKQKVIQQKEARVAREYDLMKEILEAMSTILETFMSHIDMHFGTIAEAMAREQDMAEKNAVRVMEELLTLEALTSGEVIKVADILVAEPSKSAVFFSLPPQLKRQKDQILLLQNLVTK